MSCQINKNYDYFMISNHSSIIFASSIDKFPYFILLNSIKNPPELIDSPMSLAKDLI